VFGGAVHKKLTGGEEIEMNQIPLILNADGDIVEIANDIDGDD
jgi:hypothetical protein